MANNILQKLLDEGKFDEAKRYIESVFVSTEKDEEKKNESLSMMSSYMGALNESDEQYIAVLDDALNAMKEVDVSEKESNSAHKLMEVRSRLNS